MFFTESTTKIFGTHLLRNKNDPSEFLRAARQAQIHADVEDEHVIRGMQLFMGSEFVEFNEQKLSRNDNDKRGALGR